jgi:hypothetical protein
MNIANLYRKIRQILDESNTALVNKGLNSVSDLYAIPAEISKLGIINRLTYALRSEIIEVTEDDLNGITRIGEYAFSYWSNLTKVTIPCNIANISGKAFWNIHSLADIYLHSITPPVLEDTSSSLEWAKIHVPIGSGDAYRNATNWSSYANRIVEDVVIE